MGDGLHNAFQFWGRGSITYFNLAGGAITYFNWVGWSKNVSAPHPFPFFGGKALIPRLLYQTTNSLVLGKLKMQKSMTDLQCTLFGIYLYTLGSWCCCTGFCGRHPCICWHLWQDPEIKCALFRMYFKIEMENLPHLQLSSIGPVPKM